MEVKPTYKKKNVRGGEAVSKKTIKELIAEYEATQPALHRLTGAPHWLISKWAHGDRNPSSCELYMMEKLLKIKQAAEKEDTHEVKKLLNIE